MPVITAVEFDDLVAFGKPPCQADGAHRGFRAGIDKPHHIHRRHMFDDKLGDFDFRFGGGAKTDTFFDGILHGLDHILMGMA